MEHYWVKSLTIHFFYNEEDYTAEIVVNMHSESDYGSDADGNRGEIRNFIDEISINDIRDYSGSSVKMTIELEEYIKSLDLTDYDLSDE